MAAPDRFEDAIAQQNGAFEPQRQYQWLLRIPGLPGEKVLELSLRSGNLPSDSSEEIEIPILNSRVYVAGKQMWENGEFVFNDYVDQDTLGYLHAWRDKVYNPTTQRQGYARDYKYEGDLVLYGPDFEVERVYSLKGLWCSALNPGALDYGTSDVVQISATLRFDRCIRESGWTA